VDCERCGAPNPEVASYCYRCGNGLRYAGSSGKVRGDAYALQATENVGQLALVSTVMPHTDRQTSQNYRWAIAIAAVIVLALTLLGYLGGAVLAAALAVPLTYLVYLYDVNVWQDTPGPAVGLTFVLSAALSAAVSLVFFDWVFADRWAQLNSGGIARAGVGSIPVVPLLLFAVVLPVLALVAMLIGPLVLASRPKFDDMIDGFTLGVASGTAYAAVESIVAFSVVFSIGRVEDGIPTWVAVVLNILVVKSLIYGTSAGIATAAFSGKGEGYEGFTSVFWSHLLFVAVADVSYWIGVRLLAYLDFGAAFGLLWGVVVLIVLVLRARTFLHASLIEAAVEDAANERRSHGAAGERTYCPQCQMPLIPDAAFCIVCGQSVRATNTAARRRVRDGSVGGGA